MDSAFIPAVCGFAGAAFGALVSVAGVCFAQWQETKRKMFSEVINAAVKFWEVEFKDMTSRNRPGDAMLSVDGIILCMLQFLPLYRKAGKDIPDQVLVKMVEKYIKTANLISYTYYKYERDSFPEPDNPKATSGGAR